MFFSSSIPCAKGFQSIQHAATATSPTTTTTSYSSVSVSSLLGMTATTDDNENDNENENENTATTTTPPPPSKSKLKLLDAILWDMDGVLAETERDAHRIAFNTVFKERGLDTEWTIESYGKLLEVGGGKERMTSYWNTVGWPESICDDNVDNVDGSGSGSSSRQDKVKELHLAKTDVFNEIISNGNVPLRPGVERLIDEAINANIQLAVCSTSNEIAVRNLITTLLGKERASKFNNAIFAGDIVTNKKPYPDIYNLAVNTLKLDKLRCLIIEDSSIGYNAAKASGICCIVTKSIYTKNENFMGADLIVTDLDGSDGLSEIVTLNTIEELLVKRLTATTTTTTTTTVVVVVDDKQQE